MLLALPSPHQPPVPTSPHQPPPTQPTTTRSLHAYPPPLRDHVTGQRHILEIRAAAAEAALELKPLYEAAPDSQGFMLLGTAVPALSATAAVAAVGGREPGPLAALAGRAAEAGAGLPPCLLVRCSYDGDLCLQLCHRRLTELMAAHRQGQGQQGQQGRQPGSFLSGVFGASQQQQQQQEEGQGQQGGVAAYHSSWGLAPGEVRTAGLRARPRACPHACLRACPRAHAPRRPARPPCLPPPPAAQAALLLERLLDQRQAEQLQRLEGTKLRAPSLAQLEKAFVQAQCVAKGRAGSWLLTAAAALPSNRLHPPASAAPQQGCCSRCPCARRLLLTPATRPAPAPRPRSPAAPCASRRAAPGLLQASKPGPSSGTR